MPSVAEFGRSQHSGRLPLNIKDYLEFYYLKGWRKFGNSHCPCVVKDTLTLRSEISKCDEKRQRLYHQIKV